MSLFLKIDICRQIILRLFAYIIPRDKKLIVYGGSWDLFIDNVKYQFILNTKELPNYKHVWITNNEDIINKLHNLNFHVTKAHSFKGIITILRAGFVVFDDGIGYSSYTNLCVGSVRINIWHGVVGKFLTKSSSEEEQFPYEPKSWFWDRFIVDHRKGDYCICTCTDQIKILSHCFNIRKDKIFIGGYPRTIPFSMEENARSLLVRKYESSSTVLLYEKLKNEKRKKIIYMPTFRDKDAYYLDKAIPDWELLNKECKKNGIVLYVKVHRVTPLPEISDYSNISIINNKIDIYPLLPFFDRMITDYSSIMFDFSLLGKSIVLYIYDYEEYISNSRPLYNHFKELIATLTSVNSFEKLLNVLNVSDHEIKRFPSEKYFERPQTFNIVQNLIKQLS